MSENNTDLSQTARELGAKAMALAGKQLDQMEQSKPGELTMEWILQRIDKIINDTEYIHEAFKILSATSDRGMETGGIGIGNAVEAREQTNQRMIGLLEKMYDDLTPRELRPEDMGMLTGLAGIMAPDQVQKILAKFI